MTVDERIRTTLREAAASVPYTPAPSTYDVQRRGRRRRTRRRVTWGVASTLLVIFILALTVPFDPNRIDPADAYQVDTVEIADLAVPVTHEDPVLTDPDVWLGLPGPDPLFDVSSLGEDLSFTPGTPLASDLDESSLPNDGWPNAMRAVYLGDLDGEPFYLFSAPAPSIWDRIFEIIGGNFSGDVIGTSLNCCSGGDMDHEEGLPGFSLSTTSGEPDVIVAEWLGLSPQVSVVAYEVDGSPYGWQQPVGGAVSIRLDEVPDQVGYVAFDSRGNEIERIGPWDLTGIDEPISDQGSSSDLPSSAAGWAPLESDGREIGPEEIPTDRLREVISPSIGDRLFSVVTGDHEIIVVVRTDGTGHAYATSCHVLLSVDLPPGWDGTCLERTVDGNRQVGVFDYTNGSSP